MNNSIESSLRRLGFQVEAAGKHHKIFFADYPELASTLPASGSDHRGWQNNLSDLRKKSDPLCHPGTRLMAVCCNRMLAERKASDAAFLSCHKDVRSLPRRTRALHQSGERRRLRDVLQQSSILFCASLSIFHSVPKNVPYKVEPSSGKAGDVLVVKWNTLSIFLRTLQANENR
ncbi:hypothetical protein [Desulfovibrio piger]|uniref:hypothetical protein n=1 Tax=Desulfovibrio piger TaxID=901 RepID=UPI0026EB168B|nr:hypothetical protein [Desulfovibrio piger]